MPHRGTSSYRADERITGGPTYAGRSTCSLLCSELGYGGDGSVGQDLALEALRHDGAPRPSSQKDLVKGKGMGMGQGVLGGCMRGGTRCPAGCRLLHGGMVGLGKLCPDARAPWHWGLSQCSPPPHTPMRAGTSSPRAFGQGQHAGQGPDAAAQPRTSWPLICSH